MSLERCDANLASLAAIAEEMVARATTAVITAWPIAPCRYLSAENNDHLVHRAREQRRELARAAITAALKPEGT